MKNKSQVKFTLKVFFEDGVVQRVSTDKIKRIYSILQVAKNKEVKSYYIKANYGSIVDNYGKEVKAINEGMYKTQNGVRKALACFAEE